MAKVIRLTRTVDKRCKVVARTFVQGSNILDEFAVPMHMAHPAKVALAGLQRRLITCYQIWESIQKQVDEGKSRAIIIRSKGKAANVPAVIDLEKQCKAFLESARFGIVLCMDLAAAFGVKTFDRNIDKCISWCTNHYGKNHRLTEFLVEGEPYMRLIVAMRNGMKKTGDQEPLQINNFTCKGSTLVEPSWRLGDEKLQRIAPSMANIMEVILRLSEGVLSICVMMSANTPFPLRIYDLAENEQDPECPIRLKVGLVDATAATSVKTEK